MLTRCWLIGIIVLALASAHGQPGPPTVRFGIDLRRDRPQVERQPLTLSTDRIDVYGGDPDLAERVSSHVEVAIATLPPRFANPSMRFSVRIGPPDDGDCPVRGFASMFVGQPSIGLLVDPEWSDAELQRIVAHEVGHVYHAAARAAVDPPSGDAILNEGLATWLAAPSWLADLGFSSFESAIRSSMERGIYFGMDEEPTPDLSTFASSAEECVALRDALYTQRAGFVGFLIERFGMEAVIEASRQPLELTFMGREGWRASRLDYEAEFGAPLAQLEREWLAGFATE